MAKYNKCTRTDCLHHGVYSCTLLKQLYEDQNKCKFFCDSNKYYFTNTIYQGAKCTYIASKEDNTHEQRQV